jgi:glycolate oxidase FAD binding subunit
VSDASVPQILPADEAEVAAVLTYANDNDLRVTPRGAGTKAGWGNSVAEAGLLLSMARLNRVLEYEWADLTVTVQAGCRIAALQNTLAERGQRLAFDPLWPETATVGGVLSTNDSGALRLGFGGLRDLIIGVTLCLPDGTIAKSGGKVVKNVAGYDLPKLATGALGTLGVITQAVFRLHPMAQCAKTLSIALATPEPAWNFMDAVRQSKLTPAAVQIRMGSGSSTKIEILFEGTSAGVALQTERFRDLSGGVPVREERLTIWKAREELWVSAGNYAIAKLSVIPSEIANVSEQVGAVASDTLEWQLVWYSTGLGWLRLGGESAKLQAALGKLRTKIEWQDGSLVILRQPPGSSLDAWGEVGTAKDLMRAIKKQFDPKGILNSGRFVAGI